MFGLGGMEILVILVVGVVVLGPERLPKVMRWFTKIMSEFRRVSTDLQRTINAEINIQEHNERQKREKLEAQKKNSAARAKSATVKSGQADGGLKQTSAETPEEAVRSAAAVGGEHLVDIRETPEETVHSAAANGLKAETPPPLENAAALPEQPPVQTECRQDEAKETNGKVKA